MSKGLVCINRLQLNYTSEMEKAMQGAHGVSYAVYSMKHDVRMQVEKKRQEEYLKSQQVLANLERRRIHSY
ncbi:hypothetical protein BGM26_17840 [Bacillus sp. FJAT-29790]|uniref:hypothetical protein n=1 Tax=Bacillus sp. FJAT-29790 TaxID=1895002 RepID=UPI001C23C968|nr:hypothetical protein [Bacillus sp. FJAT-29790]MBU8880817.1 hypothetical protein [Bacillus sp. FJAT-29790]